MTKLNENISINKVAHDRISDVSVFLAECWKSAYKDIRTDEYLSALKDNHWVEFLKSGLINKQ